METFPDGVTVAEITRSDGMVAPAIWVGAENRVEVLPEPLCMAFGEVDLRRPYPQVLRLVNSIAQLVRYYISLSRPELNAKGLRKLIESYIIQRAKGDPDNNWRPLSRAGLEMELRHIAHYSDFCEREYGHLPLVGQRIVHPAAPQDRKSFWRLLAFNERDFFSHLAILRHTSSNAIPIPGRKPRRTGVASTVGMTEEFAWRLIEAERNPTYKCLWLLGFFGGPRLSESLNLWICDVMPGTCRRHWFPGDTFEDLPLVVIANPWTSRWCGAVGDRRHTRQEFLLENYGLHPRPDMAETEAGAYRGKASGFKGSRATSLECEMRQIFWSSEEAAHLFEATLIQVIKLRNQLPRSRLHPYLFVNTDPRKPQVQGDILTKSNARKAFERAIRRLGEIPYRFRRSPHGMRHLYKDIIKLLFDGDPVSIQVCMGHRLRESQDDYGTLDLQAMRHAMASSRNTREQDR